MSKSLRHLIVGPLVGPLVGLGVSVAHAQAPDFDRDVLPIFEASCLHCHGPEVQEHQLRLDSVEAILRGGRSGHAVLPGDSESSLVVRHLAGLADPMMPLDAGPLTPEQIAIVRHWIDDGDLTLVAGRPAGTDRHWAYVKPVRPALPPVELTAWSQNPIDRFVLARLEREGLAPSPPALRETLIRRLSLDLIGLPPTLAEVDAFVADSGADADAVDAVVDRLLASPHFGERWARPWLDLARYADTHGYEKDNPRSIWKYRDWVIAALNDDMSFRQFTIAQIAGDLLPDATIDQQIATGFHRNTLLNQEGGVDDEDARWQTLVDRVNTTATVWLGTTLGCAQCHSHKFDPFTHEDYYRLLAFFDNAEYRITELGQGESWVVEPEIEIPTPEQAAGAAAIRDELADLRARLDRQTPELDAAQRAWEAELRRADAAWITLRPSRQVSSGRARLALLPDGSVLAGGDNPEADTYELVAQTELRKVTGVRLEVLEDASLPGGGPGRDDEGNFFLSEFTVDASPADTPALRTRIVFTQAVANDWQPGYEAGRALDGSPGAGGWALASSSSTSTSTSPAGRHAVFVPRRPFGFGAGTRLTIRLSHQMRRAARNLGRFRLSLTTGDDPTRLARLPAHLRPVLDIPESQRTPEQRRALAEVHRSLTPLLQPARDRVAALDRRLEALGIVTTLVVRERPSTERPSTPMRLRGSFTTPGARVYAAVPPALHPLPNDQTPNRLGLAHWLVDDDNPLVARVTVNRLWAQLFGRGLVETSEDFGTQGSPPTHPELLDWLATEFMSRGWSVKTILRTIVASATYQQGSSASRALIERDPYNVLLARGPRFRVEAEMVRDIALAVSGLLNPATGGPSVFPYQPDGIWNRPYSEERWETSRAGNQHRRGIYTYMRRTAPYPSLVTFDAPSRELSIVRRVRTNTPLQALTTLNDPVFFEAAQQLARRMLDAAGAGTTDRMIHGFRLCVSRRPNPDELDTLVAFQAEQLRRFSLDRYAAGRVVDGALPDDVDVAELAAWTMVANVLLNLDETITKE